MKHLLFIIAFLLLAGIGYITYERWVKHSTLSTWSFVPDNAVAVYESTPILATFEKIKDTEIWTNLSVIQEILNIDHALVKLDSLNGEGSLHHFFEKSNGLISVHITSSQTFDFLYIMEIQTLNQHTYLSQSIFNLEQRGFSKQTRTYKDLTITEIKNNDDREQFTYIFYKNFLIGSFSPFLVEDAIRTITEAENMGFQNRFDELNTITKLGQDEGNLYVNTALVSDFLDLFVNQPLDFQFAHSSFVDVSVQESAIVLNGFTFTTNPDEYLSVFTNLSGSSFDIGEIIPNATNWMLHFSFTEGNMLGEALNNYFNTNEPGIVKQKSALLKEFDFDVNYIYQLLDQEMGLVYIENARNTLDRLLIMEIRDMGEALNYFNLVGERVSSTAADSVYTEVYSDYEIRKLPIKEFPQSLLGKIGSGFDECYYLNYRNYLIFSNSIYQLKKLLLSIEQEETWTKSLAFNQFLDKTNQEANFSLYVNTQQSWGQITRNLKPEWKTYFIKNQQALRNLEYLALQFSNVDGKFYTNVNLVQTNIAKKTIPDRISPTRTIRLASKIISKPFIVTNHLDRSREILIQDSSHVVYLISKDFEVLWSRAINGAINSDVYQIDYYKNGKIQFAFTTSKAIYILDRNGELLPGFPVNLPGNNDIRYFNVIDYDNTKIYRFTLADDRGNVYLTDKNGKPLEGWNPKQLDGPLSAVPTHVRITGKDYLIIPQENGKIHFFNRRGEHYPQFPIELNSSVHTGFYYQSSTNAETSTYTAITDQGEIIEINFTGQVVKREQLYKPAVTSQFELIEDVSQGGFIILRKTEQSYEVLNASGELLFEKDFLNRNLQLQYYQLSGADEWIIFTDSQRKSLIIYDQTGLLVSGRPIVGHTPVSILYSDNAYRVYVGADSELLTYNLPK